MQWTLPLDELLEMREKLDGLIQRIQLDLGLGPGKGSQACLSGFKGSGLGIKDRKALWAEKGN